MRGEDGRVTHSPTYNPARRLLPMSEAQAILESRGGTVRRNGCTELVFSHPLADHPITTNATRRQTSDRLTAWLRQLNERRAILREAFDLKESA